MGVYSYELFSIYDVENIIRIGSSGAYATDLKLYNVALAEGVWGESGFAKTRNGCSDDILYSDRELNDRIMETAKRLNNPLTLTRVHSSHAFYCENHMDDYSKINRKHQYTCVNMESFVLFYKANVMHKNAACLLTISDSFPTGEKTSAKERKESLEAKMKLITNLTSGRISLPDSYNTAR